MGKIQWEFEINGIKQVVDDLNNVKVTAKGMGEETSDSFSQASAAVRTHAKETNSLTQFIRDQRAENRQNNFLFREGRQVIGAAALSLSAFGAVAGSDAKGGMKQLSGALNEGFMTFQGLSFALSALPYGQFIAGAAGILSAVLKMDDSGVKLTLTLRTQKEMIDALSDAYDKWTGKLHGTAEANNVVSKAEADSIKRRLADYNAFYLDITKGAVVTTQFMGQTTRARVQEGTQAEKALKDSEREHVEAFLIYRQAYDKAKNDGKSADEAQKIAAKELEVAITALRDAMMAANAVTVESTTKGTQYAESLQDLDARAEKLTEKVSHMDIGSAEFARAKLELEALKNKITEARKPVEDLNIVFRRLSNGSFGFTTFGQSVKAGLDESKKAVLDFKASLKSMFGEGSTEEVKLKLTIEADVAKMEESLLTDKEKIQAWERDITESDQATENQKVRAHKVATDLINKYDKEQFAKTAQLVTGSITKGIGIIGQFNKQASDARIDHLQTEKDSALGAIDAELLNFTGTEEEKQALLDKRAALEAKYNEDIKKEKRKAFESEKSTKTIEAIINVAEEITKVLATPWMIPIVAALGAAQVALIQSQPTPSFKRGGSFTVPPGFDNDSFPMSVASGERVDVTPADQVGREAGGTTVVFDFRGANIADELAFKRLVEQGMRKLGITDVTKFFVNQTSKITLAG